MFPVSGFRKGGRWIGLCKSADPCLFSPNPSNRQYFCSNPKPQPHPDIQKCKSSKVHSTIPLTVSHLSLNEFGSKKNNLDELINIPTKAEERSMIQISFSTQDWNIKTDTIRNPLQNSQLIHNPLCFQNPNLFDLPQKSTIRALF